MRTLPHTLFLALVIGCQPSGDPEPPPPVDEEPEVGVVGEGGHAEGAGHVAGEFHRALARGDSARMLELLHPDAIIYEGGHDETVEEYRAGHLAADVRFAAATERELLREHLEVLDDVVLYLSESRVRGTVGEREIDSRGVETMVLTRERDQWRIRHIHWSSR